MKCNVLQIVGDPVGGIRKHVHTLINECHESDYKLSYAFSNLKVDKAFLADLEEFEGVNIDMLPLPINKNPSFTDVLNLIRLVNFIKKNSIHIVHGHGAKGGLYSRICSFLTGTKSVYTPHGGVAHDMFNPLSGRLYRFIEKILFPLTDFYIFESNYSENAFCRILGKRPDQSMINYNGIDLSSIDVSAMNLHPVSLQGEKGSLRLGVFAMLREQKGQKYAIESLSLLEKSGRNASLHLFGDGNDEAILRGLAKEQKVDSSVFFYGDVSNVYNYMIEMDYVLIPSLFESFGYVALEAMALNRPVIASDVGGLSEILKGVSNCVLVEPKSSEAIFDAIDKWTYSNNITLQSDLLNQKFSIKSMIHNLQKVYSKLISI